MANQPRTVALALLASVALAGCLHAAEAAEKGSSIAATPAAKSADRGLLLEMTGDLARPVNVWDAGGKPVLDPFYDFSKQGLALVNRDYALRLEGGCFYSGGAEDYLGAGLTNSGGELTLALYVQPAALRPEVAGCIVGYGPKRGALQFALQQEQDALVFTIGVPEPRKINLGALKTTEPFHLVISVGRGEITCYRDGGRIGQYSGWTGGARGWENGRLYFGNDATGAHPWRGQLERVELYRRPLGAEEAGRVAASLLAEIRKRPAVPCIEIEGTLLARSKYHLPWDEGFTYRDVMAVCEYKVDKVLAGEFKPEKMRVAEWMYVDRIFLANSQLPVGAKCRLRVEEMEANPQLSTVQRDDSLELDMDATVFLSLNPIAALPEKQQPKPPAAK